MNQKSVTLTEDGLAIDIGMTSEERASVSEQLAHLLADSYVLYLMTHNFHWNVTGPMFNALHNMFMDQYTEQWEALDEIAERIRALGYFAPGTSAEYSKLASIDEPKPLLDATEMIRSLVKGNEAVAKTARVTFEYAEKANDQPTLDLLTVRMDVHEKNAWMLRSMLQS